MSKCRAVSWVVGKGCLLWPACSLDKTLLAFAVLHYSRYLLTSCFAFHHSRLKRTFVCVCVLALVGLVGAGAWPPRLLYSPQPGVEVCPQPFPLERRPSGLPPEGGTHHSSSSGTSWGPIVCRPHSVPALCAVLSCSVVSDSLRPHGL